MLKKHSRKTWMSVLARADTATLKKLWNSCENRRDYRVLRQPETGLVMVRGRIGGHGAAFNVGEASVTRCSVENPSGTIGHAYVLGRSHMHARIAAEIDADLQQPDLQGSIFETVIAPLSQSLQEAETLEREKISATKVDFFTMVRGED